MPSDLARLPAKATSVIDPEVAMRNRMSGCIRRGQCWQAVAASCAVSEPSETPLRTTVSLPCSRAQRVSTAISASAAWKASSMPSRPRAMIGSPP